MQDHETEAASGPEGLQDDEYDDRSKWEVLPAGVVKSVGRVLQLFEYFDHYQKAANIAEVSRALKYPQSSTSELMRSLTKLGYLRFDANGRTFIPTTRLRLLGSWINSDLHGTDQLSRMVHEINRTFGHAAFLATRNGLFAQYIHVVQATTTLRLELTPGLTRPLVRSASGVALLTRVDDAEIVKLLRRYNADEADKDLRVDKQQLLSEVKIARERGYVHMSKSLVSAGAAVIAILLPERLSKIPMVIGVGGASLPVNQDAERIVACMTEMVLVQS